MRPLRIVHVVEALGRGGLERVVHSLARHARLGGHTVEVLCAAGAGPLAAEIEASRVTVRVLGVNGYYPREVLRVANTLRTFGPDVVHSHGHFAGVLGRAAVWWAGGPVAVHHLHTIDTTLRARHRGLERFLAGLTRRVLCCSNAVATHARLDLGVPEPLLRVIPNGIEPPPPTGPEAARARIGHPEPPVIGCVGSLVPHKGQTVLLRALEHLPADRPRPTLVLIGEGPGRAELEVLAGRLRDRARVLLLGERADARSLLPALDVLVVPSVAREGFGLAAIEAMDAGIPVVASRVGGLPEVVEEGVTGLLVPPADPIALSRALTTLLDRPDLARSFGAEGQRRVQERFRAATMARNVLAIYEEVLDARRAA